MTNLIYITNIEEYGEIFPYSADQLKKEWEPKQYPCYCRRESIDGGLTGDWYKMHITYIPTKEQFHCLSTIEAFEWGMIATREYTHTISIC